MNSATQLVEQILAKGSPPRGSTFPPQRLALALQMPVRRQFSELVDEILCQVCKHGSEKYRRPNRDLIRLVLSNLILAGFRFEQLSLPTKIRTGGYHHSLGFSQDRTERIRDALLAGGWMQLEMGGYRHYSRANRSRPTQYYPTAKLMRAFADIIYSEYGDFSAYEPYEYTDPDNRWDPKEAESSEILRQYNEMMSSHEWAMKAPTVRKLGAVPFTGGRVYTHYQNIVNRRIPIRKQTLLDGEPLVECDFQSNHPYLIARLSGVDFDNDIYQIIGDKVKLGRKDVKALVTQCIGATKPQDITSVKYNLSNIGRNKIDKALDVIDDEAPWLIQAMFKGEGTRLQWLEGEISIKMFKDALIHNIPMISIHDAYAVNLKHEQTTNQLMHAHREQVIKENQNRWRRNGTEQ